MYLKAACSEIPVPRQRGGPRLDRFPCSIQQRQGAGSQCSPLKPHQLPSRKLRRQQTSRAAGFGGALIMLILLNELQLFGDLDVI
ncbi:hypothetical protein JOQ06_001890 [Pogonophryne albipinna]|uniref:Uncharacterized protein n=1 Tax=Pogonophryne albipinna TaxID=1090488 RepID=A0AAD6B6V1_9TELE|nr:hypothetical protein JOQ06_001890 [Pogonophryne albipinna]